MPTFGPLDAAITLAYGLAGVVVLILFLYALFVLVGRLAHRVVPTTPSPEDPALTTLRDRFARGEIDEAEYRRQRSALQGD